MKHFFWLYLLSVSVLFAADESHQSVSQNNFKFFKEFNLHEGKIFVGVTKDGQVRVYDQTKNWYEIGQISVFEKVISVFVDNIDYRVLLISEREGYNFGFITSNIIVQKLLCNNNYFALAQNRQANLFAILSDKKIYLYNQEGIIDPKVGENVCDVASIVFSRTSDQLFVIKNRTVSQYGIVAKKNALVNMWKYNPIILKCSNQKATLIAALHKNKKLVLYDENGHLIDFNLGGKKIDITSPWYLEFSPDDRFVTIIFEDYFDDKDGIICSSRHGVIPNADTIKNLGKNIVLKTLNSDKTLIATLNENGFLNLHDSKGQYCMEIANNIFKPRFLEFDEKSIKVITEKGEFSFDIPNK